MKPNQKWDAHGTLVLGAARIVADNPKNDLNTLEELRNIFGDLSKLPGNQHDLFALVRKAAKAPMKPRLYQCCGTEDFIYPDNVQFRDAICSLPLDLTYEEGPGEHSGAYWDKMIRKVLKWMFS